MKTFAFRGRSLTKRFSVMGILNVTPDSFSDGGLYLAPEKAVAHGLAMARQGADVIDVGACSTRPGSEPVSPETELERLSSVLPALARAGLTVSVDTYRPAVAEAALRMGAQIINDVSGVFSPEMAAVVRAFDAGWVVMHTGGCSAAQTRPYPHGVTADVNAFFDDMLRQAEAAGVARQHLCLDPGFGFGKTAQDNIDLLRDFGEIIRPDVFVMAALSRKRFLGAMIGEGDRDNATAVADAAAFLRGADLVRVHDVTRAVQTVKILEEVG